MSFLLLMVYWLVIPGGALLIAYALWRRTKTPIGKGMVVTGSLLCFLGLFWLLGGGEKGQLDRQVRELCAKDGGVKVYETVKLPADKFNQWGQPNFYKPDQGENALGPDYRVETNIEYIRSGNPSLRRYLVRVIRRRDAFVLGKSIGYDRGGGDLPGPWAESSFSCPEHHGEIVIDNIFVADQGAGK